MAEELADKVAVVTGGASGIGRAIVELFVREGAAVVVADVQEDRGRELADRLGDPAAFCRTDVSDRDQVRHMVGFAVETFGGLDVMCNNAGVPSSFRRFLKDDLSDLDRVMAVNLYGVIYGSHCAAAHMAEHGGGAIVNTSSMGALTGGGPPFAYRTSKAAIIHFSRSIATDLADDGIRVNCVAPGHIETDITSYDLGPVIRAHQPLPRHGSPEDVANAVLFLASERAAQVTGIVLPVDGGTAAGPPVSQLGVLRGGAGCSRRGLTAGVLAPRPRPDPGTDPGTDPRPDRAGSSGLAALADRFFDQFDDPCDAADGALWVDLPVDHQSLVGAHAPEHVEHRGRDRLALLRPIPGVGRDGAEQCLSLALIGGCEGRIERRARVDRIGRDVVEDPRGDLGDVVESHAREVDACLFLLALHHRVAEPALVPEVAVDGSFVDARPFRDGAHGQVPPIADRGSVEELGTGRHDPVARRRSPAAGGGSRRRGGAAPRRRLPSASPRRIRGGQRSDRHPAQETTTGRTSQPRTVEVGESRAPDRSSSHSGKRISSSSRAMRPSSRASAEPMQKWTP